ncbi:MAG TPA: hypothetical protein PKH69_05530 [Thiobacillaceae bacterium]|nr:hypothetical protein [Thiobacillaceae bacterium]HNU64168.1 hypothetical protein [Thiobacillaceae bacterium]
MSTGRIDTSILVASPGVHDEAVVVPIRTILTSRLWLSARHRERPSRDTLGAMERQLRRLAIHSQTTPEDWTLGLRLTRDAWVNVLSWLSHRVQGGPGRAL